MTILIKGMEMPTDPFYPIHATIYADGTVITGHGIGEFAKEAVSVPTPHGRLIDADALMELYEPTPEDANEWEHYTTTVSVIRQNIKDAPTVIEAEEVNND